jgi:hypothetical protein
MKHREKIKLNSKSINELFNMKKPKININGIPERDAQRIGKNTQRNKQYLL